MSKMPIVDAWIQHPFPNFMENPVFESLLRWMGVRGKPPVMPPELTVQIMQEAGITTALLSAWVGAKGTLISNEEVLGLTRKWPDLFVGIASVDIEQPMNGVRALRRAVKDYGFRGLRLLPWLWKLPPNDRRFYPLYAECIELGIPFCLQVGHTGPLMPSEFGRPIPYLDDVALEFPELVIVGGHIGYPWTEEMIALATKYPNVHIDTSAYKPNRYPPELVRFMKGHGKKKVLFGSNYPMIQPDACLKQLDMLELDEETRRLFLCENAKRVFGLYQ